MEMGTVAFGSRSSCLFIYEATQVTAKTNYILLDYDMHGAKLQTEISGASAGRQ